jgi:hypothetical protein
LLFGEKNLQNEQAISKVLEMWREEKRDLSFPGFGTAKIERIPVSEKPG